MPINVEKSPSIIMTIIMTLKFTISTIMSITKAICLGIAYTSNVVVSAANQEEFVFVFRVVLQEVDLSIGQEQ